jgi:hypothetical protein
MSNSCLTWKGSKTMFDKRNIMIIFFLFQIPAFLLAKGEGTTGGVILSQPIGVRARGMGEAYTSIEGDLLSVYYNPASFSYLRRKEISFLYQQGLVGENFGVFALGIPFNFGNIGASFILLFHRRCRIV